MRPISLTFHLRKITEKVIAQQMKLNLPKLDNQYAYSSGLSTTDALVKLSSDIATSLDRVDTLTVQALLLDFSKAFYRMRPAIAIHKLLQLNTHPSLIQVLKSFISDRQQQVRFQTALSQLKPSKIGVPQGTILGPLLWNIFVNDLSPATNHIKYADDTTLYNAVQSSDINITSSDAQHATISFIDNPLQFAANFASNWCEENSMTLNTAKSITISFSLKKTIYSEPIRIKDQSIEDKSAVKLLGVHFDTHLKFNTHVNEVLLKSKPAFHALIRLKRAGLDSDCLSSFYQARIVSIIIYAAASWYPFISKNDKTKLERYQSLCSRIILPHIDSYEERLKQLQINELNTQLDICCLKYVNRVQNESHPLNNYIPVAPDHLHHKSRATQKRRTALLDKSLFFRYT